MLGDFLTSCNREITIDELLSSEGGIPIVVHKDSWRLFYQFGIYISENEVIVQQVTRNGACMKSYTLNQFTNDGNYELYEYVPWYDYDKNIVRVRALSVPIGNSSIGCYSPCGDDFVCWCITGDATLELRCYNNIGEHYFENRRKLLKYKHHALGIEAGLVVQFSDNEFGKLDIVLGELQDLNNPNCVIHENYNTNARIMARNRALYYALGLWEIKNYNLITNNCEHFVNTCIFGKHKSSQVNNAIGDLAIIALTAMTKRANPMVSKVIKKYLF